jgi:hypothetical protein
MLYVDDYLAKHIADMRVEEALRRLETRHLLIQAGIDPRGWVSRQSRRVLCHLGRLLVALGRRLEGYGLPSTVSLEGQLSSGT